MDSYNITAIQGSTLLLGINCRDADSNYINFSGYITRGYVRYNYSSSGILLNLNPQIHPSYISGLINISGSATGLANLPVGTFIYDIEAEKTGISSDVYIFKPLRGYFFVNGQVTY